MKIHLERKSDKNPALDTLLFMNEDNGLSSSFRWPSLRRGAYRREGMVPSVLALFELHNRFPGLELVA